METKISVPQYELRGFSLWGFRDMAHCMDFLFDGGRVKQGTLVAMNAEKDPEGGRGPGAACVAG